MGCGSTNVYVLEENVTGGGVADLPTRLNSLSANPGNKLVTLTLAYSSTSYVSGVQVNWKTGSYPTSPTDGSSMTVSGAATTVKITGLINKTTYYFRVFLYNTVGGVKYYQTDITNARVTGIPRGVEITGITPLVSASDHIVIVNAGSGKISAPKGTRIILGSGAAAALSGGKSGSYTGGGFVDSVTLDADVNDASLSTTVASGRTANGTKIVIGGTTYQCGSVEQIIQSKWGPVGGRCSAVEAYHYNSSDAVGNAGTPTGAAGGGGGYWPNRGKASKGGNNGGYGNYGGNGGYYSSYGDAATAGACGAAGVGTVYDWATAGTGGGGGYAAMGGLGCIIRDSDGDEDIGNSGQPGTGIIVIEWDA